MTGTFKLYVTIIPRQGNKRTLIVHGATDLTFEFDDADQIQIYINKCLREKRIVGDPNS